MGSKNKEILIFQRLIIWFIYLFSGYILYSQKGYLFSFLISFARIVYPLSIFWLQIRIKRKEKLLPIDASMETSQLWFNLLPVLACFITVIFSLINLLLFTKEILI